ncbi:MAG: V-type ATP synthase subunit D [Trueperaceae bacterium]|nr:V-type ATP synthase subunit D [Trueperaceae bacterium]
MARDADLPHTRATLLYLRQSLSEARDGHALLERKREVLLREVWDLMRAVRQHEDRIRLRFDAAHQALRDARLDAGSDVVHSALLAPSADTRCTVDTRNLMGVVLPKVTLHVRPEPLTTSAGGTPVELDEARRRWLDVIEALDVWAETYGAVWRVAAELARTQRRVNALEKMLIPEKEAAIRGVEATLEEAERESFVRGKRVKARLTEERSEDPDA